MTPPDFDLQKYIRLKCGRRRCRLRSTNSSPAAAWLESALAPNGCAFANEWREKKAASCRAYFGGGEVKLDASPISASRIRRAFNTHVGVVFLSLPEPNCQVLWVK
jgi:hypothetical protein